MCSLPAPVPRAYTANSRWVCSQATLSACPNRPRRPQVCRSPARRNSCEGRGWGQECGDLSRTYQGEAHGTLGLGNEDTPRFHRKCPGSQRLGEGSAVCAALAFSLALACLPKQGAKTSTVQRLAGGPGAAPCSSLFFQCLHSLVASYCCMKDMKMPRP